MELIKEKWTKQDIIEFQEYLVSLGKEEKKEWATNILKTEMPVLVLKTIDIKNIINQISKGDYLSFLDFMVWDYYENSAINGYLICKIKEFDVLKRYLDIYSPKVDNWASCDLLSFNIKGKEKEFFKLAKTYIKSKKPFVRRIGIIILFNFITLTEYLPQIFDILNTFENEQEYYVNMVNAWIVCECFIKHREETILFLDSNKLNKFTVNKAVQKCRDSFRVSKEDKEMLLKYKRK